MGKSSDHFTDRYRSWARQHVHRNSGSPEASQAGPILPTSNNSISEDTETGGLNEKRDGPSISSASRQGNDGAGTGAGDHSRGVETSTGNDAEDAISPAAPPPAPPPDKSKDEGTGDPAVESSQDDKANLTIPQRMLAGCLRFLVHLKSAIFHSWVNILLVFVPIGIAAEAAGLSPGIIFGMNAIAIIPLAGLLAYATEAVAARLGDTLGALLNVSFGNAVELIIFIIALVKKEIAIVQASLLGSILANLLLILGMSFLFGGLRYREQIYNSTVTQMSACLLSLSVMSLLLPTAFYVSFKTNNGNLADKQVLKVSRGTSVVLLLVYILYLLFQLKSHAYMYESTPQEVIDEESHPGVLADIMNSSDSSSSSDSTDSDTSGSGSVATAGRKIKRVFKNRRRRKSSASVSSATQSALSSPSTQERQGNYFGSAIGSNYASRRPSQLVGLAAENDADADHEDNSGNQTTVRDFVKTKDASPETSKSPDRKKSRNKDGKKHHKKRSTGKDQSETTEKPEPAIDILGGEKVETPIREEPPKVVGFAENTEHVDNLERVSTPGGSFNMRHLSSMVRPGLPKLLSNNVFVNPPPAPAQSIRPLGPVRSQSSGANLRRTSSLPDRLNKESSQTKNSSARPSLVTRSDPLPPFRHQRQVLRKVKDEALDTSDDEEEDEKPVMSRTAAIVLLLCTTALVAVCAEFMVGAIPDMIKSSPGISQAFIGLIILPIVGNAAEHVTAVTVATKNKMDLAIGVAVGSSIQIALFVTPIVVLLGWILNTDMSLYFNLFETISLFVTAFVVNFLVLDGRSNYLEGSLLIAAYVIIALGAFFYPAAQDQSQVGGGA